MPIHIIGAGGSGSNAGGSGITFSDLDASLQNKINAASDNVASLANGTYAGGNFISYKEINGITKITLNSANYGSSLPSSGTEGQLFFLIG